jgi:hypothetical protein
MGEIDTAVRFSKTLESLLEERLGATGKGLHEKASSVEGVLPPEILRKLRYVASVRNKVVHDADYSIDDIDAFTSNANEAVAYLQSVGEARKSIEEAISEAGPFVSAVFGFLVSLRPLSIGACALLGMAFGWYTTGIGAGILGSMIGAGIGALLLSDGAIRFYIVATQVVLGFVVIGVVGGVIAFLWNIGALGPKSDSSAPDKSATASQIRTEPAKKTQQGKPAVASNANRSEQGTKAGGSSAATGRADAKPLALPDGQWGVFTASTGNGAEWMAVYRKGDRTIAVNHYKTYDDMSCHELKVTAERAGADPRYKLSFARWIKRPEKVQASITEKQVSWLIIDDRGGASFMWNEWSRPASPAREFPLATEPPAACNA